MSTGRTTLGLLTVIPLISACASYEPLGDQIVFIDAYASNFTFVTDGSTYAAEFTACIMDPASGPECGFRKNEDEEYDGDYFLFETDDAEAQIICYLWAQSNPVIQKGTCNAPFKSLAPGQEIVATINEYSESTITIPTVPTLTSPTPDIAARLGADGGMKLVWETTGSTGEKLKWNVWPDDEQMGACADAEWGSMTGVADDTGSTVVPADVFPPDLPADGCPIIVQIDRKRPGHLDPGIKNGEIFGHQLFRVNATLMP